MATLQFNVENFPYGIDNTQRRLNAYGRTSIGPDSPTASPLVFTYVVGGIRAAFVPLEPIKAVPVMPNWVQIVSLTGAYVYQWRSFSLISAVAVASGVITVTVQNNFQVGDQVQLTELTGNAAVLNTSRLIVATASAANFTAPIAAANLASTTTAGKATTLRNQNGMPSQGNVKILTGAGVELTAGAIAAAVQADVTTYRAEFVRSYQ
jgi:hypothetical protein